MWLLVIFLAGAARRIHVRPPPGAAGDRATTTGRRSITAEQSPHVGRLPDVLDAVVGDADQPHAERHGRIPVGIDHPVEVGWRQRAQLRPACARRRRRSTRAAPPRSRAERRGPPRRCGRIRDCSGSGSSPNRAAQSPSCHSWWSPTRPGQLGVLDAGDVPHQPRDRVGVAVRLRRQLFRVEPVDDFAGERWDPAVEVEQEFGHVHDRTFHHSTTSRSVWSACM